MVISYSIPNRLREKFSLIRWYLRKDLRERGKGNSKWKGLKAQNVWGSAGMPMWLDLREGPGNYQKCSQEKDQDAKLCGALQMRVSVGHFLRVTEEAIGGFWARRLLWSDLHFHRIILFGFLTESRHRVQGGNQGTKYEALWHMRWETTVKWANVASVEVVKMVGIRSMMKVEDFAMNEV